ncbi:unnamed protein product [Symbiodinium natans]|uniref:Uncharacterized protein n=1 Tax=Symbiodinium natans TaxID=878477 RepID=A0A812UWE7_9DINO|nr:unnamed protein product [Symbiodinium natans]
MAQRAEAAHVFWTCVVGKGRVSMQWAFGRLAGAARRQLVGRSVAIHAFLKLLARAAARALRGHLFSWQRAGVRSARFAADLRGVTIAELAAANRRPKLMKRVLHAWKASLAAPRRLVGALVAPTAQRLSWALRRLYALSGRQRQAALRLACSSSAQRRHRRRLLSQVFTSWRRDFTQAERRLRARSRNAQVRAGLRLSREAFQAWMKLDVYHRRLHRLVAVLRSGWGRSGLRTWRTQAARRAAKATAEVLGKEALHRALAQQKVGCEYFVEARSRECANRTAKALLHAWRCASAADSAAKAQRIAAAQFLIRTVAGYERLARRAALQRWRAAADVACVEATSKERMAARSRHERQQQMQNGLRILATVVKHRVQMALAQAFHGQWRACRWQAMVRALDASALRDQRRMRAEAETLRAQVVACREEAYEMRARTAAEEVRGDRTREEAQEIVEAVRRERASQAEKIAELRSSEREALEESQDLRERLDDALSHVNRLEGAKQSTLEDLRMLHTELDEARERGEELSKAEVQRERAHHEQVQTLQQQALLAQNAARDQEAAFRRQLDLAQKEANDATHSSEKTWELRLQEKERACELQTSIAEDQERNIRHLESLLKEQGDQLTKERSDHMRGLDQLRASTALSESKTCLLQEQVVALRQQLRREHQELLASEKAWSSDRAALLSAVASQGEPVALRALPPPARSRSSSASRRKASPSPKDQGPGSVSAVRCPWHGPGASKKLAPALM